MELNYQEIAERAVAYAKQNDIILDYTEQSIEKVEEILAAYHENLDSYDGDDGASTLWNIAVHFGIYLGETLLRIHLGEKGFAWDINEGTPALKKENNEIYPVSKAHKRILNGPEDDVRSFCKVAIMIADGAFPSNKTAFQAERVIDIELESGRKEKDVRYEDIDQYILLIENGREDFLILKSADGYLQFYGVNNQFVAETRVNLPNGDFRTYSVIDKAKKHLTNRVRLQTPYGEFTPQERDVVPLALIRTVVREYYANGNFDTFIQKIPCVDTTEEIKRCMGRT
ncbi:MAG: hypothetical protein K2K74_03570 [Lachnospiraceae bacterium]|nr:hypothetical protein [Lachnospiraceae bacterium]